MKHVQKFSLLSGVENTSNLLPPIWNFNKNVAGIFVDHARKHIPDYDRVIDLSVNICQTLLEDHTADKIVDVGCATGETIKRLRANNLCNLVGVDNSQAMLDQCQDKNALYILSDIFPQEHGPYNAVLCNWTLHFTQDKKTYLKSIFDNLCANGFLILSEKTCNSGTDLKLYHDFKRRQGVSDEEIKFKAESIKNVMFINDVEWYFCELEKIGFSKVTIVNSAPCFTTFLVRK
jgi:tRNA (cmo5U34)-methyltransferase